MEDGQATVGKRIWNLLERPGISDMALLVLLMTGSMAGAIFDPEFRDFSFDFPLFFEIPLFCTSLLLASRSATASQIAHALHILIIVESGLFLALALFLLVTVLFAGLAVVVGPIAMIVLVNSGYTITRIATRNRLSAIRAGAS